MTRIENNKEQLKQELLKKVKQGVKPSDLRKSKLSFLRSKEDDLKKKKVKPKPQPDEGYESDASSKSIPPAPPLPNKKIKELERDVKYWSKTANNHLKNLQLAQAKVNNLEEQIKELKKLKPRKPAKSESELLTEKNKQIEIIAKENEKNLQKAQKATELLNKQSESIRKAQELIKQQAQSISELQSKIQAQEKSIKDLKTQTKNKQQTEPKVPEPHLYLFTCDICEQTKKSPLYLGKVNGLGIDPHKENKICSSCYKKVDLIKPPREEFF